MSEAIVSLRARKIIVIRAMLVAWFVGVLYVLLGIILFGGATAMPGKIEAGHFYLTKGNYQLEVSSFAFWYSRVHGILFVMCWLITAALGFYSEALKRQIDTAEYWLSKQSEEDAR